MQITSVSKIYIVVKRHSRHWIKMATVYTHDCNIQFSRFRGNCSLIFNYLHYEELIIDSNTEYWIVHLEESNIQPIELFWRQDCWLQHSMFNSLWVNGCNNIHFFLQLGKIFRTKSAHTLIIYCEIQCMCNILYQEAIHIQLFLCSLCTSSDFDKSVQ